MSDMLSTHETDALAREAAENARLYAADPTGTEATELADQAADAALGEAARTFAIDGADIGLAGWGEKQAAAPGYVPKSPFRLVFELDDADNWASVEIKDPIFIWQYVDKAGEYHADEETASVGGLAVVGPIYLNLTLARDKEQKLTGALASSSVSSEKDSSADASIRLYELSSDGSILDLRHALLTLGCGLGALGSSTVNVVTGIKFLVNGNNLEVQLQKTPLTVLAKGEEAAYAADAKTRVALVTKRVVVRDGLEFDWTLHPDESINLQNKFSDIQVVAAGADTQSSPVTLAMRVQDIVEGSVYDTTTHQFANIITQALVPDCGESVAAEPVFTATAHSAETAQQE